MGSCRFFWPSLVFGQYNMLESENYCGKVGGLELSQWVWSRQQSGCTLCVMMERWLLALTVNTGFGTWKGLWDWLLPGMRAGSSNAGTSPGVSQETLGCIHVRPCQQPLISKGEEQRRQEAHKVGQQQVTIPLLHCWGCRHPKPLAVHPGKGNNSQGGWCCLFPILTRDWMEVAFLRKFQISKITYKQVFI